MIVVWLAAGCGRIAFDPFDRAPDAGADAMPPSCPVFATLCEDFETGELARWPGGFTSTNSSVGLTTDRPHRGAFALESFTPAGALATANIARELPVQSTGVLALRLWVYPVEPLVNFSEVVLWGNTTTGQYLTFGGDPNENWTFSENSSAGLFDHLGVAPVAVGAWACVELVISFAGPSTTAQLIVDGVPYQAQLDDPAPAYDELAIGLPRVDFAGAHTIIDDLVVADRPIGCL